MRQPSLRGGRRAQSECLHVSRHEHHHHHVYVRRPAEDAGPTGAADAVLAASDAFDEQRCGSDGSGDSWEQQVAATLQNDSAKAVGTVLSEPDDTDTQPLPFQQQSSFGRVQCSPGAICKVGNSAGALTRAGASAILRSSSSATAFNSGGKTYAEDVMNSTAELWNKYQRSKSTSRARMDRHPRWSTLVDDAQDRRVDERLSNLDAQNQWLQKRSHVQRQFRELQDSGVKRKLVGDPRLRETSDTHFIAKLKSEDIQRDRDRARKIKGVMQDVAQARHQLIQMQQQFKELIGEEPQRPENDILQQFRASVVNA